MRESLEYKNEKSNFNKLTIKRLKDFPNYQNDFITLVTNSIKNDYEEIDQNFAKRLIEIDKMGFDEYGFFTLGKDIWLAFYDDIPIGFEVITRKRGGSIKLGPTYISSKYRGKGFATEMIDRICKKYVKNGIRKVYVTAPISNYSTAILDYSKLNLKLEAILCKNYSKSSSERVCGKVFTNRNNDDKLVIRVNQGTKLLTKIFKNELMKINFKTLNDFVCKNMQNYFNDIDITFTKTIIDASNEKNKLIYEHKGKDSFAVLDSDKIECLIVATPKRGGNYKVSPFLISDDYLNETNIIKIVKELENSANLLNRRKISIFIPVGEIVIANVLSLQQYFCEGILKEPYKENCDVIIFSKFLGEQK